MKPDFLSRRESLGDDHPSKLELDRLRLGERSGMAADALRAHLKSCEPCRDRLKELDAAQLQYLSSTFVAKEADGVLRAARRGAPVKWVMALAATVAVVAVMIWVPSQRVAPGNEHIKGADSLSVFRKRGESVTLLLEGESVRPGDALRFEVSLAESATVLVLGLDGRGKVTPYSPAHGPGTTLKAGETRRLSEAVELDETEGAEQVMAWFCASPMTVEEAVETLRVQQRAPASCRSVTRTFKKTR